MIADANATAMNAGSSPAKPDIDRPAAEPAIQHGIQPGHPEARPNLRRFPGVVGISFYMMLLAGVVCYGVAQGRIPPLYLIFSVLFVAGALGLLMMLRWGWALVLAAVALLSASFFWGFSTQDSYPALVQGLLNLIFFLYLVRSDLREKMR